MSMTITVVFHSSWLYSDGGIHISASRRFENEAESAFDSALKIERLDTTTCEFSIRDTGGFSPAVVMKKVNEILRSIASPLEPKTICNVNAVDGSGAEISEATGNECEPSSTDRRGADISSMILAALKSDSARTDDGTVSAESDSSDDWHDSIPKGSESTSTSECHTASASPVEVSPSSERSAEVIESEEADSFTVADMVGNPAFKSLVDEIRNRAERIKRNGTASFFFSTAYLFSVNSGNGYKSSIRLLDKLLEETGLFSCKSSPIDYVLPNPQDHDVTQKLNNIIGSFETSFGNQRIVTFDISSWLGKTDAAEFKNLLMHIFQRNKGCLVVFKTPYVRESVQREILDDISDIITVRPIIFEPFSRQELRQIAQKLLVPYGFTFSDDALEEFDRRIEDERRDGYFYGVHTVKKIVGTFVSEMESSDELNEAAGKVITKAIVSRSSKIKSVSTGETGFDGFADMIGMGYVESRLREAVAQIQFARSKGIGKPCMHMFFVGNPGTGKTTVARMLGIELKKDNLLRIGKFYEHKGRDLCGEYVGQTAPKTVKICEQAYGSVLFIDEAYSLAGNSSNDYGKEAVDTLIAEMENHYDDLVVIFAGYPEEMARLLELNPGMRSRVPYTIEFPNYTRADLYQIFITLSSKHFVLAPGFSENAKQFFLGLPQERLTDRAFGNARYVRNLYERVWGKAIMRCANNDNASIELTVSDFNLAVNEMQNVNGVANL